MNPVDKSVLVGLQPLDALSPGRLEELATLCFAEKVGKDLDPFRMNVVGNAQALYLLQGALGIIYNDGSRTILEGGSKAARLPVGGSKKSGISEATALSEIEIVRIDADLLDIMMTWDQLAGYEQSAPATGLDAAKWMQQTNIFSASQLQNGVFSRLPPANIEQVFRRMTRLPVSAGQVVITQGAEGDYYYLVEQGAAEVSRAADNGGSPRVLAELKAGDAFGEEALVSDNKRNATVTMKTGGVLLRLGKADFVELLKAPLLNRIALADAQAKAGNGAVWLDVRFPSEYRSGHLPEAVSAPLHEIRDIMRTLDRSKEYIAYCQTGRRSSAAAFIMAQQGFKAFVLEGGARAGMH